MSASKPLPRPPTGVLRRNEVPTVGRACRTAQPRPPGGMAHPAA